jgi:non-specific serine/threonine protein kinase/serine/threonine-protein kinase
VDAARWERLKTIVADAFELSAAEREAFVRRECGGDAGLLAEARSLLEQSGARVEEFAVDLHATICDGERSLAGERLGAYEIVKEIGRGGMGAVFLARRADETFEKQVAIKVLKRGTDTDEVLRRFRAERQILARLEHPNIARLLDAGTTQDGLPYFVMEYVVGERVDDYCRARNLSLPARIELFLKICGAVQFAHQNLVIHRDLKPGNILITAEGEPKLLDFGIAKLVEEGAPAFQLTLQNQQRLTPAYASPEQVKGEVVTTVSDVYSLGALLYLLLADRPAHRFSAAQPSPTELWRVVGEEAPPRPSQVAVDPHVARRLRGDLDNILLTALRKEPARRYTGVGAFSEDIRRYLQNRPVRARPSTFAYTAGKFLARNRAATVVGMLAVVALLGGTAFSVWNARRADSEARRAEQNLADVRSLANSFLFEFHDAIAQLPGATEARRLVVSRALEYLDKIARQARNDAPLQLELAEAYLKIGDVQGQPYTANLGDSEGAATSYQHAADIAAARRQAKDIAQRRKARRLSAMAYARLASVQARLRRLDEATANNQRALQIAESSLANDPAEAEAWRRVLVSAHLGLGDAIQAGNHRRREEALFQKALEHYRNARPLAEELHAAHPNSIPELRLLASVYARIASMLVEAPPSEGGAGEALALHARSMELTTAAFSLDPANASLRRLMAVSLVSKAQTHVRAQRDLEAGLADARRAIEMEETLRAEDPRNVEALQDLAYAYLTAGHLERALGRMQPATQLYRRALQILEPLVASHPQNNETKFDLEEARRGLEIAESTN